MDKQATQQITDAVFKAIAKALVLIVAFLAMAFVFFKLGSVIGLLLISVLIVISLESLVKYLMRGSLFGKKISRSFAVLVSYLLVLTVLGFVVVVVLPPMVMQLEKLITGLSTIIPQFSPEIQSWTKNLQISDFFQQLTSFSGNILNFTLSAFGAFTTFVSLFVFSVYMSLDWINLKKGLLGLLPDKLSADVGDVLDEAEVTVGNWLRGEFFLMLVVGVFCYLGLLVLGVPYALALGILSGLLEAVPIIGPIVSAIVAGLVGFSDSPVKGVGVMALYIIVQQAENNLLVPKIMQKVSGFSPLVIMLALMIGGTFFGIIGAVLAVPVTMILGVILKKLLVSRWSNSDN